jgi:hypothetical protein
MLRGGPLQSSRVTDVHRLKATAFHVDCAIEISVSWSQAWLVQVNALYLEA